MAPPTNKKANKRSHAGDSDTDSENSCASAGPAPSWPRFLVIQGIDEENTLKQLSPFAIAKGIQGIAGEPKQITRLRSGDLLIEVGQRSHANNLLKATMLVNIPIKVSAHNTLNTRKGVIKCNDLKFVSEAEILEGLSQQKVKEVKHIKIMKDGNRLPTGTIILTFDTTKLPQEVKVGYLNVPVAVYVPNPMRCFQCQRFGHHQSNCKNNKMCAVCGKESHGDEKSCTEPAHCINCNGDHPSFSKKCPKWVEEKEIQTIKCQQNIPYKDARKIVENRESPNLPNSYAGAVGRIHCKSTMVQTDFTWLNAQNPRKLTPPTNETATKQPTPKTTSKSTQSGPVLEDKPKPVNTLNQKEEKEKQVHVKINRQNTSDRTPKGSEDPIIQHNKFQVLEQQGEEEMVTDFIPRTPAARCKSLDRGRPQSKKK